MSFRVISFLIAFLAAVAIYVTARLFRRDKLTIRVFLMWMGLWLAMGFFALFPAVLDYLMKLVSMGNRMVFLFVSSIVILFAFVFYLSSRVTETYRKLARLVQEISILNFKLHALQYKQKREEKDDKQKQYEDFTS